MKRHIPFLMLLVMSVGSPSRAALIIDQAVDTGLSYNTWATGITLQKAQTFTVGIAGTLSKIELPLKRSSLPDPGMTITIDVRPVINGIPVTSNQEALGVVTVPYDSISSISSTFTAFDFSSFGIAVNPGDVLAIVVRTDSDIAPTWYVPNGDVYSGGTSYYRSSFFELEGTDVNTLSFEPLSYGDHGFRTYVNAVPEPSSIVLMTALASTGFVLAWNRRRMVRK